MESETVEEMGGETSLGGAGGHGEQVRKEFRMRATHLIFKVGNTRFKSWKQNPQDRIREEKILTTSTGRNPCGKQPTYIRHRLCL